MFLPFVWILVEKLVVKTRFICVSVTQEISYFHDLEHLFSVQPNLTQFTKVTKSCVFLVIGVCFPTWLNSDSPTSFAISPSVSLDYGRIFCGTFFEENLVNWNVAQICFNQMLFWFSLLQGTSYYRAGHGFSFDQCCIKCWLHLWSVGGRES